MRFEVQKRGMRHLVRGQKAESYPLTRGETHISPRRVNGSPFQARKADSQSRLIRNGFCLPYGEMLLLVVGGACSRQIEREALGKSPFQTRLIRLQGAFCDYNSISMSLGPLPFYAFIGVSGGGSVISWSVAVRCKRYVSFFFR